MSSKYEFIDGEKANYPIIKMCRWAGVSRSGFYEWRDRPASATTERRVELAVLICQIFEASDGTYGYRRVRRELADEHGVEAGSELVRQIMADEGLVACQPRPFRVTTIAGDDDGPQDLCRRDFSAEMPGIKLVGDITYVRTWAGWVYVATVIDCCTRMVVGYAMSDHMRTSLVIDALAMARRNVDLDDDCVFHSDRGSQGEIKWSSQHLNPGGGWTCTSTSDRRRFG